jgi:hypothetical protein
MLAERRDLLLYPLAAGGFIAGLLEIGSGRNILGEAAALDPFASTTRKRNLADGPRTPPVKRRDLAPPTYKKPKL